MQLEELESPYDGINDLVISVEINGKTTKLTTKETMEQRVFDDALSGHKRSVDRVLSWIHEREMLRAPSRRRTFIFRTVCQSPIKVDEAALILGIATVAADALTEEGERYLELEPWVVNEALGRPQGRNISQSNLMDVKACTRDPQLVPLFAEFGRDGR